MSGWVGGWVGGWADFTPIINPIHSPTFMIKTSKMSTQVEIASWSWVWQHPRHFQKPSKIFKQLKDTFQTCARHLLDIFHTPFRHLSVILLTAQDNFHTLTQKSIVYKISAICRVRGARAYTWFKVLFVSGWVGGWLDITPIINPSWKVYNYVSVKWNSIW